MNSPQQPPPSIPWAHPPREVALALAKVLGAVVFPVGRDKKPAIREWEKLTLEDATRPRMLALYGTRYPSIGVLLGKPSGNLCSIDLDSDDSLETFLKENPKLASSLTSRAHRGGNIWVRIRGDYPSLSMLRYHGEHWGEWRADGGYTIVAGVHPKGMEYRRTGELPVETVFSEIRWPEGITSKGRRFPRSQTGNPSQCSLEMEQGRKGNVKEHPIHYPLDSSATSEPLRICDSETLKDCASSSLHHNSDGIERERTDGEIVPGGEETKRPRTAGEILARKEAIRQAREQFERENPRRARLYGEFMERRWEAKPKERNQVIVEAVPFLYRAIAEADIVPLLMQFHRLHHAIFRATPEEHRYETEKMLEGVRRSYREAMPEDVGKLYDDLDGREQTAFRICRDLSLLGEGPQERTFFMSSEQLAHRMNLGPMQTYRLLLSFDRIGLLETTIPGTRHSKGKRGIATTYRWCLNF